MLEAKLAPLDTLRMTTAEMVQHYPTPQMVKAMVDGKAALSHRTPRRAIVEKLVARVERKEAATSRAADIRI